MPELIAVFIFGVIAGALVMYAAIIDRFAGPGPGPTTDPTEHGEYPL
ncbi:hypothetical protein [Bradyrhizobium prioriisuperbiae]|nr:hypothetical protein [Bradyrhizobium prioritasuperba]